MNPLDQPKKIQTFRGRRKTKAPVYLTDDQVILLKKLYGRAEPTDAVRLAILEVARLRFTVN